MGLFSKKENKRLSWQTLEASEQLKDILELSKDMPVLVFKHSTRCGVSAMALSGFEREWDLQGDKCKLYFLDLLKYRSVSNEIAELSGVVHQSPQVIILQNKEVIYTASHDSISPGKIKSILN